MGTVEQAIVVKRAEYLKGFYGPALPALDKEVCCKIKFLLLRSTHIIQGVLYEGKQSPTSSPNEEPGILVDLPAVDHLSPLESFNTTDGEMVGSHQICLEHL